MDFVCLFALLLRYEVGREWWVDPGRVRAGVRDEYGQNTLYEILREYNYL